MITITEQREEVEREVRQRERIYPEWIERGRLKRDTAERKIATLKRAADSLRLIERHAVGLRALAHYLVATDTGPGAVPPDPTPAERAALLAHPAVAALLAAWPDAETRILPAPSIAPPEPLHDTHEPEPETEAA